jgi:DNA repair protein RecN (Recombination protein N)
MLSRLCISNFELIDHVEQGFYDGLNVITGETGTGKSMILSALNLLLGGRGSDKVLKDPKRKCILEARLKASESSKELFIQNDLDWDNSIILRREFNTQGRSRAFINDTPVTLEVLKKIASQFIDIHSQDQTKNINQSEYQLELLDIYSNSEKLLLDYQNCFQTYELQLNEILRFKEKAKKDKEERDFLQFQFEELQSASLRDGEIKELEEGIALLSKQEEIKNALEKANFTFSTQDQNVLDSIQTLYQQFSAIKDITPWLNDLYKRISEIHGEIKDLNFELESRHDGLDLDPARLTEMEDRMHTYYALENKFDRSGDVALIELREEFKNRLEAISSSGDVIEKLEVENRLLREELLNKGSRLSKKRSSRAPAFGKEISGRLKLLGIEHPSSIFSISQLETPSISGLEEVHFLFSSNKDQKARLVEEVASGGEKSRIMLAIKSIIGNKREINSMIFDEIDTGISGEVAIKTGELLMDIGMNNQVISITHLPQVASKGSHHFKVSKSIVNGRTNVRMDELDTNARVEELAEMLGGKEFSSSARKTAIELLN